MTHQERDQHTIHRLEAFSDIVIGFCLAQAALNLVFPKSAADLPAVWTNAGFFLMSFSLIAVVWWFHHRTFNTYFVLNPLSVGLNFALLASLVLSLYFLQIFLHVAEYGRDVTVYLRLWLASFGVVYGLLGMLLLTGTIALRAKLSPADLRWSVNRIAVIVLGVAIFTFVPATGTVTSQHVASVTLALSLAMVLFGRVVLPRLLRRIIPDR